MPHDDGPEVLAAIPDGRPYGKSTKHQNPSKTETVIYCKPILAKYS